MHTRSGLIKVGLQSDCISDVAALSVASVPSSPIIIITMITAVCSPSLVCRCNLIKSECNVCIKENATARADFCHPPCESTQD